MSKRSCESNEKMKKHQHLVSPSIPILLLQGTKKATIKACWKVRTTIVSTTFQNSSAMRISITVSLTNAALICACTTIPAPTCNCAI